MKIKEVPAFFDNTTFTEIVEKIDSKTPLTQTDKDFKIYVFKDNKEGFFAATHFEKKPNEKALEVGTAEIKSQKYSILKILKFLELSKIETTQVNKPAHNSTGSYGVRETMRFLGNNAQEVLSTLKSVKNKNDLNDRRTYSRPHKRKNLEKAVAA